jgi:hypothetical protein
MDAGKIQWIAVVVGVVLGLGITVSASPVRTYGGSFDLRIPADPNNTNTTRGWMDDAVIQIPDHFTIADLDVCVTVPEPATAILFSIAMVLARSMRRLKM